MCRYWALFLGRPTMIKDSDLGSNQLSRSLEFMTEALDSLDGEIYRFLLQLMEFARQMTEIFEVGAFRIDVKAYLAMAALDRKLNEWYSNLPDHLKWRPVNIQSAPAGFLLLQYVTLPVVSVLIAHSAQGRRLLTPLIRYSQQFYALLILLHRPFASYSHPEAARAPSSEDTPLYPEINELSILSRKVCFDNSIRLARIFKYYYSRFQGSQMFITGLDHAGTAATALIAGIASLKDPAERVRPLRYLQAMRDAMKSMGSTYKAAERMANVLDKISEDPDWSEVPKLHFSGSEPHSTSQVHGSPPSLKRKNTLSHDAQSPPEQRQGFRSSSPGYLRHGPINTNSSNTTRRFYKAPTIDRDPGFGLDSVVTSSNWNLGAFPTVGTKWPTDTSGLNLTDPLFFDDDFLNIDHMHNDMLTQTNGLEVTLLDDQTNLAPAPMVPLESNDPRNLNARHSGVDTLTEIITGPSDPGVKGPVSPIPYWPSRQPSSRHLSMSDYRKNFSWM